MPLVYLPTDVKRELKLRTVAAARGLWSREDFPGVVVEGRMLVDVEAFSEWWKKEWTMLTANARASCSETESELAAQLPASNSCDDFDFSHIVLRPAVQRR